MRATRALAALLLAPALVVTACSDDDQAVATGIDRGGAARPDVPDGAQEYETTGTVIEYAAGEVQLCLGPQTLQHPPSCGGTELVGWDWDEVDDEQSTDDRTWGAYRVVGTYADGVFTLTRPPEQLPRYELGELPPPPPGPDLSSPCPEPAGGWRVVDAAITTEEAIQAANLHAQGQPDYGAFWVDHSLDPAFDDGIQPEDRTDPARTIVNVSFTGDLERHEAELREVWGGPLCVVEADIGWGELTRIAGELMRRPGVQSTAPDGVHGVVRIGVVVDDGLQAELDRELGEGVVRVEPQLRPVD